MTTKMTTIGWQGVTLKVPEDWSLVGIPSPGETNKGHFRIDSPIASAVEVRWDAALGKAPDLLAKGREFLSKLEKASRKAKSRFSSKIKADKDKENSVTFSWSSDRLGLGRLFYCEKCDRVIIAQVVTAKDEKVEHLAPSILDSLRDHREDGWIDWAMYGLAFAVPESYRLEEQKLMSGYMSLTFKDGPKRLVVQRWGLASTLLAKYGMEDWYRKDVLPDVKGYKVEMKEGEILGHEALVIEGRRSGIKQTAKALVYSLTLHPHPGKFTGYAWYCDESNRLFGVRATHTEGDDIVEKVRDLIVCCGK